MYKVTVVLVCIFASRTLLRWP